MRFLSLLFTLCLISVSTHAADQAPEGFTSLFNGKDFSGWKVPKGDNGHWKILDGVIDYDGQSEAKERHLWSEKSYGDFELYVDWRIKETPYTNPRMKYVLPDGNYARDVKGNILTLTLPDSDSGILLRGDMKYQLNIWCWPIGSGEMYGVRNDKNISAEVRAAVVPKHQADNPVGEWNTFHITCQGNSVSVDLNGVNVIDGANIPGLPENGPIGLQHHGNKNAQGEWTSPPALLQFRNISIRELK